MTPAEIEPETFRLVAQHINPCATAFPKELVFLSFIDVTLFADSKGSDN